MSNAADQQLICTGGALQNIQLMHYLFGTAYESSVYSIGDQVIFGFRQRLGLSLFGGGVIYRSLTRTDRMHPPVVSSSEVPCFIFGFGYEYFGRHQHPRCAKVIRGLERVSIMVYSFNDV